MDQTNLELWEKRMEDIKESGMSVKEWCHQNHFTIHAYHYWRKRIKANRQENYLPAPLFAEVAAEVSKDISQNSNEMTGLLVSFKDLQISISSEEDAILAAVLISQLLGRC